MTSASYRQLWESLHDAAYRREFADEQIGTGIAFQLRMLRERRKLSQVTLAKLMGDKKKQPMISEWENPNYGKYTLATLKEFAKAFDVALIVRFAPFSELATWTDSLTAERLAPPSFNEEVKAQRNKGWLAIPRGDATNADNIIHLDEYRKGTMESKVWMAQ